MCAVCTLSIVFLEPRTSWTRRGEESALSPFSLLYPRKSHSQAFWALERGGCQSLSSSESPRLPLSTNNLILSASCPAPSQCATVLSSTRPEDNTIPQYRGYHNACTVIGCNVHYSKTLKFTHALPETESNTIWPRFWVTLQ